MPVWELQGDEMRHALLAASLLALVGCVVPPRPLPAAPVVQPTPVHPWGAPIFFGGIEFDVQVAGHHAYIANWVNQVTYAGTNFVVVGVIMTNRTGTPLPHHLQPVFKLVDDNRAVYEVSQQHTINLNMQKPGRLNFGQGMNPNVPTKLEIVFEAPKRPYRLAVFVPDGTRARFAGSSSLIGPFFLLDLARPLGG